MIFESHAHYEDERFNEDRKELLESFPSKGIGYVVNVASSLATIDKTLELMKEYDFIYGTVGVHPEECATLQESDMEHFKELCKDPKVVAIGEIGLDYYWNEPEAEIQKKWFIRQLQLAKEVKLPVIIHSRDAAKDTMDIMKEYHAEEVGGVVHCFSYSVEMAQEFIKMGFYIGVGGVVTFKNGKKLKEVVEHIPLERILIETDCPYMAPVPHRGERNSSLNLKYIAEEIARIKHVSYETVVDVTRENAKRMYQICKK